MKGDLILEASGWGTVQNGSPGLAGGINIAVFFAAQRKQASELKY
jgi:hypothetical protein